MKAVVCALLLCVALVAAESSSIVKGKFAEEVYQNAFTNWMQEHKKTYASTEFGARYNAFKWNYDFVEDWNAKNYSTVLGMNILADLTNAEYRRMYLGTKIDATEALMRAEPFVQTVEPLAIKDWRTSGAVTGVKDQGQCGSCWSFSATGSIEGAYFISKGKLVSLSEQNLMDCSTSYGNAACNGGLMTSAFKYVQANKGIDTEASYPYTAKTQTSCKFTTANIGATITGYKTVSAGSESALVTAIGVAPVSVAIDASKNSFQLYKSGTYYEASCSSTNLDHGVLAVGYDTDYYIVKNSWGTSWGMSGYINMSRNRNNNCGIATQAAYATA